MAGRKQDATIDVPHLGGHVEVQSIPPPLLRSIRQKSVKLGRLEFQELMVWKLVYGVKAPKLTEADAREVTHRWTLGSLKPIIDTIDRLSGTDEHLRDGDLPHAMHEPAVMAKAWLDRFPSSHRTVLAVRPRTREHRPAGLRRAGASSATSSADPGGDDPPLPESVRLEAQRILDRAAARMLRAGRQQ